MKSNSYWYLGLGICSLLLIVFICLKKGAKRSLLLFFIMVEVAYLIETVIYIFLESYRYSPEFLSHSEYFDSNMGALASNLLTVPACATLIATFQLGYTWILVIAALLYGIEYLFSSLGIFTAYWWRPEYTALGLMIGYFPLAKWIYRKTFDKLRGALHSLFLFLMVSPISGTLNIVPIMLFTNRYYLPGWFSDPAHDTTAFASIYYVLGSALYVFMAKLKTKKWWIKYVAVTVVMTIITIVLTAIGILRIYTWWDPWYYILYPSVVVKIASNSSKRIANADY